MGGTYDPSWRTFRGNCPSFVFTPKKTREASNNHLDCSEKYDTKAHIGLPAKKRRPRWANEPRWPSDMVSASGRRVPGSKPASTDD
ncbi:hypothetical protein AVEN_51817-1 [Araneus ventricosus]|uniref:Uncharacterized protein n=1 Tax=Araneus ventricosus TaxID=182803 RepID=A0A4Y2H158_ARAVE|nr:hypothetical protein AVEN_51817-1 [Araneus ventricosus]